MEKRPKSEEMAEVMKQAEVEEEEEEEEWCKIGAIVEVCLEDEGFRGSWYSATVLRHHTNDKRKKKKKKKILVEFHTLLMDEKTKKNKNRNKKKKKKVLLREWVDMVLLRPIPPPEREEEQTRRSRFELDEDVDAFHKDGWWEGVITDVIHIIHPQPQSSTPRHLSFYSVFFRSSREQLVFPRSRLRLHREWVHPHWVPPLTPPPPPSL